MRCIAWLWSLTEKKGKIRFITALAISAFTSVLLLVNPTLSAKLVDDVIVAQNPEPLLGILAVMLAVKLGREGAALRHGHHAGKNVAGERCSSCAAGCSSGCSIRTPGTSTATAPAN